MLRTARRIILSAAGATLALAGVLASASTAHAATNWTAKDTQADVVGAHAYGTFDYGPVGGTSTAHVTVRDSAADKASGRVYFRWRHIDGTVSGPAVLTATGYLKETSRTFTKGRGWLDTHQPFEVRECQVDDGIEVNCGWWDVPHPYN
ncbi:hypothetical protein [Streptomyces alboflavus]|uniref:hypothetical protein n=1 Tax=Streptomyces alboflavus TaxID=67267 RepID=UPI00133198C3|nr:hypothetical protein [Streptomyces alboflavus]